MRDEFQRFLQGTVSHHRASGAPGSWKGKEPKITYATVIQVICIDSNECKKINTYQK